MEKEINQNNLFCLCILHSRKLYTVKNDRDFKGKKLWKCYSKNLLNG